jgi:triosephosphate isomerase
MRTPLIAGNWKMNTNINQAVSLAQSMLQALDKVNIVDKVLCPPFVSLGAIKDLLGNTSIKLGAQNMYYEDKGAYTGEISPLMLVGLCDFVILGHSERRQYFAENNEMINKKIRVALESGLIPILCVGEKLHENETNMTEEVITTQIRLGLTGIKPNDKLVVAYEPIWAIGTGKAATAKKASSTIKFTRDAIASQWGKETAQAIRILYGGSVTSDNIKEFISEHEIDGALVGGASLKSDDFVNIVTKTAAIKTAR